MEHGFEWGNGTERNGTEWNGTERNGTECKSIQWNRMDSFDLFVIFSHMEIILHCIAVLMGSMSFSIIEALIAEYLESTFDLI